MKITLITVGKLQEKYFVDAANEYIKRLGKYVDFKEINLRDEPIKDNASLKEEENIKIVEGRRIIDAIPNKSFVMVLGINGTQLDSVELAKKIDEIYSYKSDNITLIIGGSLGLSEDVYSKANYVLSFSKMTFPHQLMKVILLEQIYRAFKINNHEKYHK